ncbi:hypothetical protein BJ508DRAFT_336443 [Ascobolus immersus RN42]|uniref:Ty3 transposon capsid-like protein domain-containing protein n=1 Tax=Ascobolus immersus RN42 TaxID=1160509 RepID=A0A3N4HF53_ASCIM|nr:hypothetical protein BJ508DRAFT_336443 [Ascobolus immersus RN42]
MSRPTTPVKRERKLIDILSPRGSAPAPIQSGDEDPDYQVQIFTCTTVITDPKSIPVSDNHDNSFVKLFEQLGDDNNALEEILWKYVETTGEGTEGPDIIQSINRQFDIIRIYARYALRAYDEKKKELTTALQRVTKLQTDHAAALASHDTETDALQQELTRLENEVKTLRKTTDTKDEDDLPDWLYKEKPLDKSHSFEIPKALRLPLQSNPITTFDGTGDTEVVFKFLRDMDHHIKLLIDDFNDAQRIKYKTGYMAGTALDWAINWRLQPGNTTWKQFITAFRAHYVSPNAHIYLTSKLERMEFKATAIDAFNHEYKSTLRLLELDPLTILESSQYYQIYVRKIKDPQIVMAIQQLSFSTTLTLSVVMDYAARLLAAKLAAQPSRTAPARTNHPARPPAARTGTPAKNQRRPFQPKINATSGERELSGRLG